MTRHRITVAMTPNLQESILPDDLMARLEACGEVRRWASESIAPSQMPDLLRDTSILVTGWRTPALRPTDVEPAQQLKLVAHTAGSVKALVPEEVFARGVEVVSAASAMAPAVAELALISTMMLLRRPHAYNADLHAKRPNGWGSASGQIMGREVSGTKIGIVGASRTGRAFIEMLRCLGPQIRVADPYLDEKEAAAMGVEIAELDEILPWCDVLSLHAPLTEQTRGMIGARELAMLRDGAALVNTARADLIEPQAMVRELLSGRICAAIDAHHKEPLPADDPLRGCDNVLLFPHMGAATVDARRRQGTLIVGEIERFVRGEPLRHRVQPELLHVLA